MDGDGGLEERDIGFDLVLSLTETRSFLDGVSVFPSRGTVLFFRAADLLDHALTTARSNKHLLIVFPLAVRFLWTI